MSLAVAPLPFKAEASIRTYSVDEYDNLIRTGAIPEDDGVELLEGYVVHKMPANPQHDTVTTILYRNLSRLVPAGWSVRCQTGTRLSKSRPEPDIAIARGPDETYFDRHPGPADLALVVEVSDSSLERDQLDKTRIYSRDSIPVYWIVNLVDRRVEVHSAPSGPGDAPRFRALQVYAAGSEIPVELDGTPIGTVLVDSILPPT